MRIKNVILSTLIPVIASFSLSATAGGGLNGTYVGTGSGSALFALCGFDANGVPKQASAGMYEILLANTESRFTFRPDGTGTLQVIAHVTALPNPLISSAFPDGLRFPWFGAEIVSGEIGYTLDKKTGEMEIFDISTQQQWISGPLAGFANTTQIPIAAGNAVVSDDKMSIKFTASSQPRTFQEIVVCDDPAQIVPQLSSMLIRQNQAPDLIP